MTEPGIDREGYRRVLREAVYQATKQEFYKTEVVVGLDEEFMVRSHLMLPKGFEMNLYSYMLNFQLATQEWLDKYKQSKPYPENDIYIFANPEWSHPDFPNGLALFMPRSKCGCNPRFTLFWRIEESNSDFSLGNGTSQWLCGLPWWNEAISFTR